MLSNSMLLMRFPKIDKRASQVTKYIFLLSASLHSRQTIIILFWKYLVDNRCEAWLSLCWEYINRKSFAVHWSCKFRFFNLMQRANQSSENGIVIEAWSFDYTVHTPVRPSLNLDMDN
jgi:hypothetical protein